MKKKGERRPFKLGFVVVCKSTRLTLKCLRDLRQLGIKCLARLRQRDIRYFKQFTNTAPERAFKETHGGEGCSLFLF